MVQAMTVKTSAKLCEITNICTVLPNETRCTGKFEIVKRFFKMENHIQSIPTLDAHLKTPPQRTALEKALPHLQKFESVVVILQKNGLLISNANVILDQVCEDYPTMSFYLS